MTVQNHFQTIYATEAARYDRMVAREDYENNLAPALAGIAPLEGATVAEFGAGTGRLTRLLLPQVKHIYACDASAHMLENAVLPVDSAERCTRLVADNRQMPLRAGLADIAIAGWSFGHSVGWYPQAWRDEIALALAEMARVLRTGGVMIVLETLGTGNETPKPPHDGLAAYYAWLENDLGFQSQWFRTDYQFESLEEADALTRFFFGDALADRIVSEGLTILPECTGIWWKRRD